ncbi:hypothetical protein CFC21_043764 [Triticum aestivum]|uniref:RING-type domain-containing protein n=3 Tax=Triticum aestivum TaxID=4565 RepID=A0A9R1FNW2_WHEAT|nr:hypothetical protein CFC21_043762 [Triticum aestivum]KAF7032607.1 hypothetical protein CFC21_043763 [Triticum aestivum]KAF7032608.1 hypothetical protein CFC21_043764 [Triticum aestivum]CDM81746.1 unnamed protein product [Triticum aestivum]CDM85990.1 unnamed protein product [Triticum aestivum]
MLLTTGGGHHQHANRPGASAAAMPATASGPCYGAADQYSELLALPAVDLARKGGGAQEMTTGNKRRRVDERSSVLGDVLAAHAQQQTVAVDHILHSCPARKMWAALAEQRRSHLRLIVSTVEARAAKRLKAKDDEIERVRAMNWALEERLRNIYMEAQMWRDAAKSHEAAANVLRADLQRVLDAQAVRGGGGCHGQDDAESCCWGENEVPICAEEEVGTPAPTGVGRCKACGDGEAVVLLLPCRHLCVCAPCAAAAQACPSCGCAKNGSVCVNFS